MPGHSSFTNEYAAMDVGAHLVPDPGNGGTINVVNRSRSYVRLTIEASVAETRSLADPAALPVGTEVTVQAYSVGSTGTAAVTATGVINAALNTTCTLNSVWDWATFRVDQVASTGFKRWRLIANDGCSLS